MRTNVKITVVGDGFVGKTCLLIAYRDKKFSDVYVPTIFENFAETKTLDGVEYEVKLWDTAGQEDYERLRPLSYPKTTCFLLCFSIDNVTTLTNVQGKWYPEISHFEPHTPAILVGTKSDMRDVDDPNLILATQKEIKRVMRQVKALKYFECSAKTCTGIDEIFDEAIRSSNRRVRAHSRVCTLL